MAEPVILSLLGWNGVDLENAPVNIPATSLAEATNVFYGASGEVTVRPGWDITTTSHPGGLGPGRDLFLYRSDQSSDDFWVYVAQDDGHVYAWSTSATAPVLQTTAAAATVALNSAATKLNYRKTAQVFMDYLFIADLSAAYMWDGDATNSWVSITDNSLSGNGVEGTPEFPLTRSLAVWGDRMIAGNCKSGGTRYASRIYFSNVLAPWTWDAADYIDINPDDGGEIQRITVFGGHIIIFKDTAVYALVGDGNGDPADLALVPIHSTIGCDSAGLTVAQSENLLFWADPHSGVYVYNGAQVERIDRALGSTIPDNAANSPWVWRGFWWDGRYYLSINEGGGGGRTETTYVFDARVGGWSVWGLGWRAAHAYEGTVSAVGVWGAGEAGMSTILDPSIVTDEGGDGISFTIRTAWLPQPDQAGLEEWRLRRLQIRHYTTEQSAQQAFTPPTVNVYNDYGLGTSQKVRTDTLENGWKDQDDWPTIVVTDIAGDQKMSRGFAVEITHTALKKKWELYSVHLVLSTREQRRGVNN